VKEDVSHQHTQGTEEVETTKFLGLQTDSIINWNKHTEYVMPKLSSSSFAMGTLMKTETLKLVYFCYLHSITSYGNIL
jgi:hypothetical protein